MAGNEYLQVANGVNFWAEAAHRSSIFFKVKLAYIQFQPNTRFLWYPFR